MSCADFKIKLEKENKGLKSKINRYKTTTIIFSIFAVLQSFNARHYSCELDKLQQTTQFIHPSKVQLKYTEDSLPALVFKEAQKIYLQNKKGNFVEYNKLFEEELIEKQNKINTQYQLKKDSLRNFLDKYIQQ